jgi:hypothetical protein
MLLTGDLRSVRRSEAGGGEWRGRLGRAQSVVMDRGQKNRAESCESAARLSAHRARARRVTPRFDGLRFERASV